MTANASTPRSDRVAERRRAVGLARHFREAEDLSIAQIAQRVGRSERLGWRLVQLGLCPQSLAMGSRPRGG
jgi:hypothetical protein